MAKQEIAPLPPYPRLGECYRLLAKALDTKASNRQVDQLARQGDFDWQLLASLRDELLEAPLSSRINAQFARFVASAVETLQESYVQLIKTIALDALPRGQPVRRGGRLVSSRPSHYRPHGSAYDGSGWADGGARWPPDSFWRR